MKGPAPRVFGRALVALPVVLCSLAVVPVLADDPWVARISVLDGAAVVKRADGGDTTAAIVNAPLMVGDYVTTQDSTRAEIEFDASDVLRMSSDTQLRFSELDAQGRTIQLATGTVELRVLADGDNYPAIQTPSVTVRPNKAGAYRVSVLDDGSAQVTVRLGEADLNDGTDDQTADPGNTVGVVTSDAGVQFQTLPTIAVDDFDSWNADRDRVAQATQSYQYVDSSVVGADDLDLYGQWVSVPGYGEVWSPNVAAGWAPYTVGRWVWEPYYGWTWVAAEPWGWAPYHYGRWFHDSAVGWCWYPERVHAVWRPALVAFFSFGAGDGGGVSVGFGNIGWVPLGPREQFHPWWGGVTYVSNATYRNFNAPGGAVWVSQRRFAMGDFSHPTAVSRADLANVSVVRGTLPVVPTEHNLDFGGRPAAVVTTSDRFSRFSAPVQHVPTFAEERESVRAQTVHTITAPNETQPHDAWSRFSNDAPRPQGDANTYRPQPWYRAVPRAAGQPSRRTSSHKRPAKVPNS
ncbi:MAG TPA: DUF6600 domain-containing protein [Candidatus Acidoferrales bacterium]|nr:DUF6600 domain-containing protein [Candidatus Acidoferrales bacterium]